MDVVLAIPRPSPAQLSAALEGLVALNAVLLQERPRIELYHSGVRYQREALGAERWQNVDELYRTRVGDCEDLAAALAAELRVVDGIPARAVAYRSGANRFHAVVLLPDGAVIDPSKKLGMRSAS